MLKSKFRIKLSANKYVLGLFAILIGIIISMIPPVSAFATLSISPTDFISNDPDLNGRAFLLTVAQSGVDQYAVGSISGSNIKSDGINAKYDLKIETTSNKQQCQYPLSESDETVVYKASYTQSRHIWYNVNEDTDDVVKQCRAKDDYLTDFRVPVVDNTGSFQFDFLGRALDDFYCVTVDVIGLKGKIGTEFRQMSTEVVLTSQGQTTKGVVGNSEISKQNVLLRDPLTQEVRAKATWNGALDFGEECPRPETEGYSVVMGANDGNWRMISRAYYEDFLRKENTLYGNLKTIKATPIDDRHSKVSAFKSSIDSLNLAADKSIQKISFRKNYQITSNSLSNGKMNIDLSKAIRFPVITMAIKASWIGIVEPVCQPEIRSLTSSTFKEGSEGDIQLRVKNTGDFQCSFKASASCQSPFSMKGGIVSIDSVKPQEERTVTIPILGTTNEKISRECSVNVYDASNSEKQDTEKVTVTVEPLAVCFTTGQKKCDGESPLICNSQGQWVLDSEEPLRCVEECDKENPTPECEENLRKTCEEQNGKLVKKESNPPAWKFWEDTEITYQCRIPKTPILALVFIIGGIGGLIWMIASGAVSVPVVVVIAFAELIGWIWLLIGRAGLY